MQKYIPMQTLMNKSEFTDLRKELRNHSTSAEATLWNLLKNNQIAKLKFRRQHSVGPYVLDFYCPKLKLAIELDGEVHNRQQDYDEKRTSFLTEIKNIKVLRFENRTVFENAEQILKEIEEYAQSYVLSTTPPAGHPSSQEEGNEVTLSYTP
jgi:very-short-patch-repair endonuclease